MANEDDWVADVRRWCVSASTASSAAPVEDADAFMPVSTSTIDLGYEAAHPMLQARHWPDAPRGDMADLA